jgi:exodeoxyribonuclease-5
MNLTPDQRVALRTILDALAEGRPAVLAGYAGTGKTTLLAELVPALQSQGRRVLLMAPTHKAVAVAARRLPGVRAETLQRALGMTLCTCDDGEQRLMPGTPVDGHDVWIVDEASMVGQDLYEAVSEAARAMGLGVVWVGDPAQLPPVETGAKRPMPSPVWRIEAQARLRQIVRQEPGSGIIPLSMVLRRHLEAGTRPGLAELREAAAGASDVVFVDGAEFECAQHVVSALEAGRSALALAWTNRAVGRIEDACLQRLGRGRELLDGDMVIAGARYHDLGVHVRNNATACIVGTPRDGGTEMGLRCVWVQLDVGLAEPVEVLAACSWEERRVIERRLLDATRAHAAQRPSMQRRLMRHPDNEAWQVQHKKLHDGLSRVRNGIADLRHVYASTAHKAQGSTVDVAVVHWHDLAQCADDATFCSLAYVAVTRASEGLVVVG